MLNTIYEEILDAGLEVLFDDRKAGPGFKFKDSDLLGLPVRVVLGERDFKKNQNLRSLIVELMKKISVKKKILSKK